MHEEQSDPLARFRHTTCLHCNYDMRGAEGDTHCPECGLEFHPGFIFGRGVMHGYRTGIVLCTIFVCMITAFVTMSLIINPTPDTIGFIVIYVVMLLFMIWLIKRGRPPFGVNVILCNAHGWTADARMNTPGRIFHYTPWSDCAHVDLDKIGMHTLSVSKHNSWELRITQLVSSLPSTDAAIMARRFTTPYAWDTVTISATEGEAHAITLTLNTLIDLARDDHDSASKADSVGTDDGDTA